MSANDGSPKPFSPFSPENTRKYTDLLAAVPEGVNVVEIEAVGADGWVVVALATRITTERGHEWRIGSAMRLDKRQGWSAGGRVTLTWGGGHDRR